MSINLEKGQKISLEKQGGGTLNKIFMGLGWDAASGGLIGKLFGSSSSSIDLDASCLLFNASKQHMETVYFGKLKSSDGSIKHSGDNLTGAGDGDDEVINIDLTKVPTNVEHLVFTINSYRGQTFDKVENCFSRIVDAETNQELSILKLKDQGAHTGMIMCRIYRHNGAWKVQAIGKPCNGSTANAILPEVLSTF